MLKTFLAALLAAGICLQCSGSSVDARCESLCTIKEPSLSGAYDICSQDSANLCKDTCQARIKDTATVCASCLLEGAKFGASSAAGGGQCDQSGQCTLQDGRGGSCTYTQDNQAQQDDCIRQLYPRREVACDTTFKDVSKCSTECAASPDGGI